MKRNIYADVIKDAIGNDPVLDQYEFDYTSNYIESAQDDHITGTFISKSASGLSIDARGRSFSTYATPNVNSIGSSAAEISKFPRASARLQSNREVSSTQQLRHSAPLFDDKERWYDSCLPDLFAALQHDGTHIKSLTTSMKINSIDLYSGSLITFDDVSSLIISDGTVSPQVTLRSKDAMLSLSPLKTFLTKSVGFVTFNVPRINNADDPSINNEWTWSYPYEGKFNPKNRLLNVNDVINLNLSTAQVLPALSGSDLIFSSSTPHIFPLTDNRAPFCSAPLDLPWQSYSHKKGGVYQINSGIVPILPGKFDSQILSRMSGSSPRNGNRTYNVYDEDSYFYPVGRTHDRTFGHFTMVMGDTFLNQEREYGGLPGDPEPSDAISTNPPGWTAAALTVEDAYYPHRNQLLPFTNFSDNYTGSAGKNDLVRFFFGFGDVNNMNYGRFTLDKSLAQNVFDVSPKVQALSAGPPASSVRLIGQSGSYTEDYGYFNAKFGESTPNGLVPSALQWRVAEATGASAGYHQKVEAAGIIYWPSSSSPSNDKIIGSSATTPSGSDSKMFVDLYSDSPWRYTYLRCVASDYASSYLESAPFRLHVHGWSDIPTSSAGEHSRTYNIVGYPAYSAGNHVKDLAFSGSYYGCYGEIDHVTGSGNTQTITEDNRWTSPIYPPGLWRVGFIYHSEYDTSAVPAPINRAFIFDLKFEVFGREAYTPDVDGPKIGGNNYPEFRQYGRDIRNGPSDRDYPFYYYADAGFINGFEDVLRDYSSDSKKTHRNRHFRSTAIGLGPVIRGWKHGLVSGFPTYSRATWRRNRFGQLRDMLEQRTYTKFVYDYVSSPLQNIATPAVAPGTVDDKIPALGQLEPGPVEVNYVKRLYKKDDRGIGYVYNVKVDGLSTQSQNVSAEVTSSLPYLDGVSRMR